jgi:hypothetical protein
LPFFLKAVHRAVAGRCLRGRVLLGARAEQAHAHRPGLVGFAVGAVGVHRFVIAVAQVQDGGLGEGVFLEAGHGISPKRSERKKGRT